MSEADNPIGAAMREAHRQAAGAAGAISLMIETRRLSPRRLAEVADKMEAAARALREAIAEGKAKLPA